MKLEIMHKKCGEWLVFMSMRMYIMMCDEENNVRPVYWNQFQRCEVLLCTHLKKWFSVKHLIYAVFPQLYLSFCAAKTLSRCQ